MFTIIKKVFLTISLLVIILLGSAIYKLNNELNEYKKVYDNLELFEDGSWTYKDGIEDYYFWNWELDYIKN